MTLQGFGGSTLNIHNSQGINGYESKGYVMTPQKDTVQHYNASSNMFTPKTNFQSNMVSPHNRSS